MSKRNKKILTAIVILLLLYYLYKIYLEKTKKTKTIKVGNLGEARYRCDAGGCLECPVNIPNRESVCPFTDSNCGNGCSTIGTGISGCMDSTANNFNSIATIDDGSCTYTNSPQVIGCMDQSQMNYDPLATFPCPHCCVKIIFGCNDPTALNYYPGVSSGYGCCCVGVNSVNDTSCCRYSV